MKAIVTDDSVATRMILGRLLTDLGFDVTLAGNGDELFELLATETPDLFLVDWNMPGMNGTEVVAALKADDRWVDIPAIIVTDETKEDRIQSALDAGASGYLPKPFKKDELASMLIRTGLQSAG